MVDIFRQSLTIPRDTSWFSTRKGHGNSNIAAGRVVRQSSEFQGKGRAEHRGWSPASNALDATSSASVTDVAKGSWWEVDLGASSQVTRVRAEVVDMQCPYWIMVSSVPLPGEEESLEASLSAACEYSRHTSSHGKWDMKTSPAVARFVRIQLEGTGSLSLRSVTVEGIAVAERDGLSFDAASSRKRLSDMVASSSISGRDHLRLASPCISPGKPYNHTVERGVHHLQVINHTDAWRDYNKSWQPPPEMHNHGYKRGPRPVSRGSRPAWRGGVAPGEGQQGEERQGAGGPQALGPDGWTVLKNKPVRAEKGDKGTNMLERLSFQAGDCQRAIISLLKEEQLSIKAHCFTGKVKSMSKDRQIVELDVNLFGPHKVSDIVGMVINVGGETRKIESWNRLSYKATVVGHFSRAPQPDKARYVIKNAGFMEKWCGDLNGLQPVMSHEERGEVCSKSWATVDSLDLSILRDNRDLILPTDIMTETITPQSLRELIELTLTGQKWWTKVSPSEANRAPAPADVGDTTWQCAAEQLVAIPEASKESEGGESAGSSSRASSTFTATPSAAGKGTWGDACETNSQRSESVMGDTSKTAAPKPKTKDALVAAHQLKKSKANAKEKADRQAFIHAARGTVAGLILCLFVKFSSPEAINEECSKTIMGSVVLLKLAEALHGLENARQEQNLLRHTTGPKIIRVPKALPRTTSRF